MSNNTNKSFPRPNGHHVLTPHTSVKDAPKVVDFLQKAFGGEVVEKLEAPNGVIIHAEVMVGDSVVMVSEPMPGASEMPASLYYYVDDSAGVDKAYAQALKAGGNKEAEPEDHFWGYRSACVSDVGGNRWTISTIIEQLTGEEIAKRMMQAGG